MKAGLPDDLRALFNAAWRGGEAVQGWHQALKIGDCLVLLLGGIAVGWGTPSTMGISGAMERIHSTFRWVAGSSKVRVEIPTASGRYSSIMLVRTWAGCR